MQRLSGRFAGLPGNMSKRREPQMKMGSLRDHFLGVAAKRLTAVDAEPKRSNQHEINTTSEMRKHFLGEVPQKFSAAYIYLGNDVLSAEDRATLYDTRMNQPHRGPEWRICYSSNPVTESMRENDSLFLAMDKGRRLHFIVAPGGSTSERQLSWLFDLQVGQNFKFSSKSIPFDDRELNLTAQYILDNIGIDAWQADPRTLDKITEQFGMEFPNTRDFSKLARQTCPDAPAEDDPDAALEMWIRREEAMFRRLEAKIVSPTIDDGFRDSQGMTDVTALVNFALSVINRRKSRAGQALEHHAEALFRAHGIRYVRGFVTEKGERPDFLFPSSDAYRSAPDAGAPNLAMLGVKVSCKDRWRQILAEASKIPCKHLLTVDKDITESQASKMQQSNLQIVIPTPLQVTYTDEQRVWFWSVRDFIQHVRQHAQE